MRHWTLSHIHMMALFFCHGSNGINKSYFIFSHPYSSWIACIAISILNMLSLKPNNYIFHWNPGVVLAS